MLSIVGQPAAPRRSLFVAGTGSHCPVSGIWAPAGETGHSKRVLEGSIMPTHGDSAVDWQLVQGLTRHDLRS
ncbi:hypothetical protein [Paenarthrobacter nitroguajacolicus]|uniref:hypothetical protein n=1 Tax=Paenarthrobacter nitroguajacolicus TaxID=211146 RepID=UPI00248BB014|nr:hypothetical protein [Paenarthrobacter nitroguajacolicus]MDI2034173.1 hypothetical protein [Paenarthrobacter nitroguajacolicus]